jgi:hypothetical protein
MNQMTDRAKVLILRRTNNPASRIRGAIALAVRLQTSGCISTSARYAAKRLISAISGKCSTMSNSDTIGCRRSIDSCGRSSAGAALKGSRARATNE